jgi:hypothetical protein
MSRLRTIKPGFFLDEELAECSPLARLLFAGIWTIADREGRLEDRPRRIKVQTLPYDDCDVDELLGELERHGFVTRYEADGARYIAIPTWHKHQNPHVKEGPSTIPAPCLNGARHGQDRDEPCGVLGLGSCLGTCHGSGVLGLEDAGPEDNSSPVDNSEATPRSRKKSDEPLPEVPIAVCGPVAKVVGKENVADLLTAGTDLNVAAAKYIAKVDELADKALAELTDAARESARNRCRRVAFERIAATHAGNAIANLPAYLTTAGKRASVLGDLVGDEAVRELRAKPPRGKGDIHKLEVACVAAPATKETP